MQGMALLQEVGHCGGGGDPLGSVSCPDFPVTALHDFLSVKL